MSTSSRLGEESDIPQVVSMRKKSTLKWVDVDTDEENEAGKYFYFFDFYISLIFVVVVIIGNKRTRPVDEINSML